jgi:hypothetical protein
VRRQVFFRVAGDQTRRFGDTFAVIPPWTKGSVQSKIDAAILGDGPS